MLIATYIYPETSMTAAEAAVFSATLRQDISQVLRIRHIKILPGEELSVSVVDKDKALPNCARIIQELASAVLRSASFKSAVRRRIAAQPGP